MKAVGDNNRNNQQLLRLTKESGTDNNARIWVLKCRKCLHIYGCNSTDAFERKCPECQNGAAGLGIPVERDGQDWTHDEHLLAFELYNRIPFGTIHVRNPLLLERAALLGRKIGAVSYKLANFARLDPIQQARDIKGMPHGAKGEEAVWEEFGRNPEAFVLECERLLASRLGKSLEELAEIETDDLPKEGVERQAMVRIRVNQSFFRKRILSAYDFRCCVTGLSNQALLTASHILPWAENTEHRLNPKNGLCLNALHDRAFDRHLMWIEGGYIIRFSRHLAKTKTNRHEATDWLTVFEGKKLILPKNFAPATEFLEQHAEKCRTKEG